MSTFNESFTEIASFYMDALSMLGVNSSDIVKTDQDIACKCPICGDSKYRNKKRLHLYKKGDVINVNCFNGDCPVVNMTPYRFFKEYAPRIFEEFRLYNRKKFLREIQSSKLSSQFTESDFSRGLRTIRDDSWLDTNMDISDLSESSDDSDHQLLEDIRSFKFTKDEKEDLKNFTQFVHNIKKDPVKYNKFKLWIS